MLISDFDFDLPKHLIASRPLKQRDHSRLLVLHHNGKIEHRLFFNIVDYLNKGDLVIMNETKVFPARIIAKKSTGGLIDVLLVKELGENTWEVMYRGKYEGDVYITEEIKSKVWTDMKEGSNKIKRFIKFPNMEATNVYEIIWKYGSMPLPKYIGRQPDEEDKIAYQTVYAKKTGSIAAPTAGLHFTEALICKINNMGVNIKTLTLHVGLGTFKPIKTEKVAEHNMEAEFFEITPSLLQEIEHTKQNGNRVITVGTTSTRALEGFMSGKYCAVKDDSADEAICGYTDIFIYPGYKFKVVDSLITNFHLPKSTPLMLVSAISSRDKVLKAYMEAIAMGYRFFSYGDAMLIL